MIKDDASLPQKATGFRYGVGIYKDTNLTGNYFTRVMSDFGGVYYWDNQDYNEQSLYLSAGLKYRKINSNIPMFYSRQNAEWFLTVEKAF